MKTLTRMLIAAAAAGSLCGTAHAQITTPPPEKPVVPEEYKPVDPAPVTLPGGPITINPGGNKAPTAIPNVPYEKLAKVDPATGKFKLLAEPAEWVAVKTNPLVTPEMWAQIATFRKARIERYEQIVIQNLGAIDQVRGGVMDQATPSEKEKFGGVVALVKPLTAPNAPAAFASALQTAQLLTPEQASLSRKMANEYAFEIAAGAEKIKAGKKPDAEKAMVEVLKQRLEEPMFVYRMLQIEASGKLGAIAGSLKDAAAATKAKEAAGKLTSSAPEEDRVRLMTDLEKEMSVDDRKAMYEALLAGRGK
ncbi:MAG: hypothetical protein ACOYN0_06670 [Phycisphaerales bacterium]